MALTLASLAAAAPCAAAPADARLRFAACSDPSAPPGTRCGTYTVVEDRDSGQGRTLDLNFVVVPNTGGKAARHAIVFLAGGPGQASVNGAAPMAQWLAELRADRDLLLVDQRGTGASNPLRCPYQDEQRRFSEYLADPFAVGRLAECRAALERRADLTRYTSPYAADDLDELRAALGYESLDLIGGSYGTRLALVYARRHPAGARTLTLLGPAPLDARIPFRLARDFDAALYGSFADCAADAACAAAFPDLAGDLRRALERVAAGVPPVTITAAGKPAEVTVSRQLVLQALRYMLYHPTTQIGMPYALHRAAEGDFEPVAAFAAMIGNAFNRDSDALYLSVTCAEDVARFDLEEGRAAAAGTLLGSLRVDHQKAACALWPTGRLPADYHQPFQVQTPALVLVGERDPATPPDWGREVAASLPNGVLVIVPRAGHETIDGLLGVDCLDAAPKRLIATGTTAGMDVSCAAAAKLPPYTLAPEAAAIELPAEELAALVGTYVSDKGFTLVVELVDGALEVTAMGRKFGLEPLSTERFRIVGGPPGYALVVVRDGGRVSGAILEEGPVVRTPLQRQGG